MCLIYHHQTQRNSIQNDVFVMWLISKKLKCQTQKNVLIPHSQNCSTLTITIMEKILPITIIIIFNFVAWFIFPRAKRTTKKLLLQSDWVIVNLWSQKCCTKSQLITVKRFRDKLVITHNKKKDFLTTFLRLLR